MFKTFLICILAGLGAGIGTGFAGLSAAAVISPLLITFLGIDSYTAVGISLASDVLASATSAFTYGKNKNIDIKNGLIMLIVILCLTFVGSYVASFVSNTTMSIGALVTTLILGLRFIFFPIKNKEGNSVENLTKKSKIIRSILCGIVIGFICGFVGAGGGMMMLFALTSILGYDIKKAVGTSVFIMTITALTGSISHFSIGEFPDWLPLTICIVSTFIFAKIGAVIANKISPKAMNLVTGIILTTLSISLIIVNLIQGF